MQILGLQGFLDLLCSDCKKKEDGAMTCAMYFQGRITSELVGIGAQCRGERHDQIIMRQREALAELRARVKTLEQAKPPRECPLVFDIFL